MVDYFGKLGVSKEQLLSYLGVNRVENINAEQIFELRGLATALKEGSTTLQDSFQQPIADSEDIAAIARSMSEEARKKVDEAIGSKKK